MRLHVCELLVSRPVGVDPAQLVEIASRAGEDDPPDVRLGRQRERRARGERGRQVGVFNVDRRDIDLVDGNEEA